VIVAFPCETEAQFQDTLSLMEDIVFDMVNTAAYSPRPGTPAAEWANQLDEVTKQDRLQRINQLVNQQAEVRSRRYLGRTETVLVEAANPKDPTQVMGRTRGNRLTFFPGDIRELKGKIVPVTIQEIRAFSLTGVPCLVTA